MAAASDSMHWGLWPPSRITVGRRRTTWNRPGHVTEAKPRRTASSLMRQPRCRRTSTVVRATAALRSWCVPNRGRCSDRYAPKWNTCPSSESLTDWMAPKSTTVSGAPAVRQRAATTSRTEGAQGYRTAWQPGLMMPDLVAAICSTVSPSTAV